MMKRHIDGLDASIHEINPHTRVGVVSLSKILQTTKIPVRLNSMRPPSGESGRGSVVDFALILILFSIVLVVIIVLLGPAITDFLGRLVTQ
jgi:hypothetical protein